jgi:ABC-type lipoprotein export system ATPase subunit
MWRLQSIEVNGGFLPGLKVHFPPGLTCIIGPRGSGKSTLAELIRFVFHGTAGANKTALELLSANLGSNGLVTARVETIAGVAYTITRGLKQPPLITTVEGRAITGVDLDRGTFLPLDAYSSAEIEAIADETLGEKRRALLDDLGETELRDIQLAINEHRRMLEANADRLKAQRRLIADLGERLEDLGDVRSRLSALEVPRESDSTIQYANAAKQQQLNVQELKKIDAATSAIRALRRTIADSRDVVAEELKLDFVITGSQNAPLLQTFESRIRGTLSTAAAHLESALSDLDRSVARLGEVRGIAENEHGRQLEEYARLTDLNDAASGLIRARASLEQQVAELSLLESDRVAAIAGLSELQQERSTARARYLAERDRISDLRELIAAKLQVEAGENVRIRVVRHADDLSYRHTLLSGLRGARVRNHEDLLRSLMSLRPEQLAQLIDSGDANEFESLMSFGADRSQKVFDALRDNIDPLQLEITPIEDRVRIELNVATGHERNYKDASELSRGQKCTALLPLLLARRESPLVIDQPEDNLDNHFIYETVVASIVRRKHRRQMIFITHNANIPVLAEAELIAAMNSDGKVGYVESSGTVDECRDAIIDLLEGGEEAFALRSRRYARS